MSTAVSLARAQKTGRPSAGSRRAKAMTPIFGASAARVLARPNITRMVMNSRRRSKREKYAVRKGPNAATVKANNVTSRPAWGMLISRSREIEGNRPTITNSVVSTVNPAADNSRMGNNMNHSRNDNASDSPRAR